MKSGSLFYAPLLLLVVMVLLSWAAFGQEPPQDEPRGAPYNTSVQDDSVSLRDFTAARIDLIKVEIDKAIEGLRERMDEREKQYNQRFDAQQEAVGAALQAAKEAVLKAEAQANQRFESVNEFRQTLTDQATTFMSKAEADARFTALEEDTRVNSARIDASAAASAGQISLWAIIAGVIVLFVAVGGMALNIINRTRLERSKL